jgi:hypothetical protein
VKINTINEGEVFALSDEITVEMGTAGDYSVAIIDNIYKNPEMVRELFFQIPPTDAFHIKGGCTGPRIHCMLDQRRLATVFLSVAKKMFDYAKDWEYESAEECFCNSGFIGNLLQNETMLRDIRVPHLDAPLDTLMETILANPTKMIYEHNGMAGLIYLNTPEECAGGTRMFKYKGSQTLPVPEEELDYDLDHYIMDTEGDWECIYEIEMKWNRLVIYPAYIFHAPWIEPDMGFEGDRWRINQVIFA